MNKVEQSLILTNRHRPEEFPADDANTVLRHYPNIPGIVIVSTFAIWTHLHTRVSSVNGGFEYDEGYWAEYTALPFRYFELDSTQPRWDSNLPLQLDVHGPQQVQGVRDFHSLLIASAESHNVMNSASWDHFCSCCRNTRFADLSESVFCHKVSENVI